MKAQVEIEKIKNAVILVERITGKNLTLPILSSILFVVSNKSIKLRSTNLSLGIEIEISAKVSKEGVCAVSGSILSNLFSTMSEEGEMDIELSNSNLVLTTKKNNFLLKSQPHDDFPTLPNVEGSTITLPAKKFIEGLKSVYFSASTSEIKPEIASVYVYPGDGVLTFVGTDSFRLAEKKIKAKDIYDMPSLLIPFKNIIEIMRVFGEYDGDIAVVMSKNQIVLRNENIYLTSRIIDGVFPDYHQIIPKEFKTEVVVLKQDFINALKVSNVFSDKFNQITLTIDPKQKLFSIKAKNADVGENHAALDAALSGEPVVLNVNYKYIFDCFQSISQDSIVIKVNSSNKPLVISGVSDSTFLYLVMPMNH